jgi:RimJ/RimL family protein N-acetyltransferase
LPSEAACIHRLGRGDELQIRAIRLRALADAPRVFAGSLADEELYPLSHWTDLVAGTERVVFAAVARRRWVGMAGGRWFDREHGVAQLWGTWVEPAKRGHGVAQRLVAEVDAWARRGERDACASG